MRLQGSQVYSKNYTLNLKCTTKRRQTEGKGDGIQREQIKMAIVFSFVVSDVFSCLFFPFKGFTKLLFCVCRQNLYVIVSQLMCSKTMICFVNLQVYRTEAVYVGKISPLLLYDSFNIFFSPFLPASLEWMAHDGCDELC